MAHIRNLRRTGRWPAVGLVVCCGLTEAKLASVRAALPPAVAAQLVPYAWSLSSQPGPPTKKPQKVKAKEVLAVANVAPRDGDTSVASDRAFLNSVYPPK